MKWLFLTSTLGLVHAVYGETWNVDTNGDWNNAGNWNPASFPNAVGATAIFDSAITATRTISSTISVTVGAMTFNNANEYFIQFASSALNITCDKGGPTATITIPNTNTGAHVINTNISIPTSLTVTNDSAADFNIGGPANAQGSVSGAGSLIKEGTGRLILAKTNSYQGGTFINNGTVQIPSPGSLGSSGNITFGTGALFVTIGGTFSSTGTISITSSANLNAGSPFQIAGPITGNGSLTASGGDITLTNSNNNYQGGTFVSGGRLFMKSGGVLPLTGAVTLIGGGSAALILEMTAQNLTVGDLSCTNTGAVVSIDTGKSITFGTSANTTYNGFFQGTSASIIKQGSGIFDFSGTSLANGGTTINDGTFNVSGVGILTTTGAVNVNGLSAIFNISGITPAVGATIGDLTGVPGSSVVLGGKALTIGTTTTSTTFAGGISGLGGSIVKQGSGTAIFSGTNGYTGGTTINAGTLSITSSAGLGTGGGLTFMGGVLQTKTSSFSIPITISLTAPGTFETVGVTTTLSGVISGSALTKIGTGTLSLTNAANSYTGLTTINAGTLSYGADSCIFPGNSVTVGDGATSSTFSIEATMTAPSALNVTINAASTLVATSGTAAYLTTLLGAGTLNLGTGNCIVNVNPVGSNSFPGVITGGVTNGSTDPTTGSSLTKSNIGTLTLNNPASDFISRTFVANGTLEVQDGLALGAAGANSAVYVRSTTPATLRVNGSITLVKTVFLNGAGFLGNGALHSTSGANTISGNLTLGWTGTGEAAAPVTIQVDAGSTLTATGMVSGNQPLTKIGSGTLVLTNMNNYSGGTTITAGTLQGNTAGLQGNILNNATLVFDQTAAGTYAGAITGSGAIVKQGTGIVLLSGVNNTPVAPVTVSAGSLIVNGSLSGGGTMTVASGALLGGNGTIDKSITCSGTLAPGNSIDTINLIGAQILATGSILDIEINPTTSDLVNVTGTMTIQPGATINIDPLPGNYANITDYTVIQTTGGVSGTFANVTSSLPLFTGSVTYTANDVLLQVVSKAFTALVATGNAGQVAHCLNGFTPASGSDLASIINALRTATSQAQLTDALLSMQPSQYTAVAMMQENNTLYLNNGLFDHLESLITRCQMLAKGIHLWAVPFTAHQIQKHHGQNQGYKATTPGVLLGLDGTITKNFILGGALGYSHSDLKWTHHIGTAKEQAGYGTIYSRWGKTRWFLESSLIYGYSYYETRRAINADLTMPIQRNAKGTHHGMQGSAHLKAAADWNCKKMTFEPFAEAGYIYIHENRFKEKGAQSLDLDVSSKNSNLLVSEAGLKVSRCSVSTRATITPYVQASGIYESRYMGKHVKALFNGCPLNTRGLNPSRALLGIEGGVNVTLDDQASIFSLFYKGRFAGRFIDNAGYFQASVTF